MTGQEKLPDGLECCFKALAKAVFSEEGTVYFHRTFISFDGSDRTRVITRYSRKDNAEYNAVKTAIQTDCDELPSITLYGKDNTTCEVIVVKRTIRKSPQETQFPSGQAS